MSRLNPNTPETSGIEWLPTRPLVIPLKVGAGTGIEFVSTAAESIASLHPRVSARTANAQVGVDVYALSNLWSSGEVYGGADSPDADAGSSAGFQKSTDGGASFSALTVGTAHTFLVKPIAIDATASYIAAITALDGHVLRYLPTGTQKEGHILLTGPGNYYDPVTLSAGNDPTGDRVGWIEVNVVCRALNGSSPTVDGQIRIGTTGGTNFGSDTGPHKIKPAWDVYTYQFFTNPATGRQWTSAEIAEFLTAGGTYGFGFSVKGPAGTDYQFTSVSVVFRALTERRLATGYGVANGDNWCSIPLLDPTDHTAAAWAKGNATAYLALCYLTGKGGNASLVVLDEATLAEQPAATLTDWLGAVVPSQTQSEVPAANPQLSTYAPALYMLTGGGTGVDGQPYHHTGQQQVATTDGQDSDDITAGATDLYGIVDVVVSRIDAHGAVTTPNAPLTVTLDGSATADILPADVPADGRWHLLSLRLDSSLSLTAATPYTVAFTTTSTVPWAVALIGADGTDAQVLMIDQAGVFNGTPNIGVNYLVNMKTVPAAPTGFTAAIDQDSPDNSPLGGPATAPVGQIGWSTTALGGDFDHYELQRQTSGEGDWIPIFILTDETIGAVNDVEVVPATVVGYRIRVVRTDGAASDWTLLAGDTLDVPPIDCGYILAANGAEASALEDPIGLLAFQEVGDNPPAHAYARANASSATVHLIAGRRTPAAFRNAIEGDSDVFQLTFLAAMDAAGIPADPVDRAALDKLLTMIEDPAVEHISLSGAYGRRWYVFAEFVTGPYSWQGHETQATVKFTEITPNAVTLTAT